MNYEKEITMAKKKNKLGKFLAFTTTAAAIGGTCYIFRDRIKESTIYKAISSKLSDHFDTFSEKFSDTDDDFFYDEDENFADAFPENAENSREYTSITINAKEEPTTTDPTSPISANTDSETKESAQNESPSENEESPKADISSKNEKETKENDSSSDTEETKEDTIFSNDSLIEIFPKDYENKGLSDVSEDPDTLEEQDKLDF